MKIYFLYRKRHGNAILSYMFLYHQNPFTALHDKNEKCVSHHTPHLTVAPWVQFSHSKHDKAFRVIFYGKELSSLVTTVAFFFLKI
jgi:hypothetical protein